MLVKVWVIPLLYLDFEIRRDYIVANLCENRNRPMLNCNGKCYLAKKLKEQQQKQDQQTSEKVQNIPVIQLFASAVAFFEFLPAHFMQAVVCAFPYQMASYQAPLSILVPPPCL